MLRIPRCERRPHHLNPRAPFPRGSPHLVRAALPGGEIDPPPIARERGEPLIADSARHARRETTFGRDEITSALPLTGDENVRNWLSSDQAAGPMKFVSRNVRRAALEPSLSASQTS